MNSATTTTPTTTTVWIMLTFCIQYKSSKTTYTGPHTDSIFMGGGTYTQTDLYTNIYAKFLMGKPSQNYGVLHNFYLQPDISTHTPLYPHQ